jgi:hercynine metabolism protein
VSGSGSAWFEQLEAKLEQQLEAFLRANPAQEALLQEQEQQDRARQQRERRLALQQQAEGLRAELLELAAEISRWQQRVGRARQAGAEELAGRAEAHLNGLMEQGRQRWQLLVALGEAFAELDPQPGAPSPPPAAAQPGPQATAQQSSGLDLDQAWARFEADQELEQLRRRRGG